MTRSELAATWLTAIGTVGAVIVALLIALFQDRWRRRQFHPNIVVTAITAPPDCVQIPFHEYSLQPGQPARRETTSYFLRIRVSNNGNETARNVEVYAKALMRERKDGKWELVKEFPPMNLVWSNSPPENSYALENRTYLRFLPPGMSKHCDIGYILHPAKRKDFEFQDRSDSGPGEVLLAFDLVQKPLHLGHIVKPGRYSLEIVVAADNVDAVTNEVEVYFDGKWHPDQKTMFDGHVRIRVGRSTNDFAAEVGI